MSSNVEKLGEVTDEGIHKPSGALSEDEEEPLGRNAFHPVVLPAIVYNNKYVWHRSEQIQVIAPDKVITLTTENLKGQNVWEVKF